MSDSRLWLSVAERQWLALSLPSDFTWPAGEHLLPLLGQLPGIDNGVGGGPRLRVQLLAMAERSSDAAFPLDCSLTELWLLDSLLMHVDLRMAKLPDGMPLLTFAHKVWSLLLDAHDEQLPQALRRDGHDASSSESSDATADALASAEAILRSGHSARA